MKVKLVCPKCHRHWAVMAYKYNTVASPSAVKVVAGTKKKFSKGDGLDCSLCGYEYTNWDLMLNIAEEHKNVQPGEEAKV